MNKLKTILLSCLCFAISTITAQTYSGGSGTQGDPYLISSNADMVALANAVNGGTTYSGKDFLLTQDLTDVSDTVTSSSLLFWRNLWICIRHYIRGGEVNVMSD